MALAITDSNFEDLILKADKPAVVDFWATWCGPCRMISPVIEALAEKYEGKVVIGKCNVDEASDVPVNYGIRNIPTILFFKDGELADRLVGAVPQSEIENKINSLLG